MILLITVLVTTIAWIAATFATAPEPKEVLKSFYTRVRPGGPGWTVISSELGFGTEPIAAGRHAWLNWLAGVVAVYSSLFGIGKLIFGEWVLGIGLLALAGAAFAWIARALKAQDREAPSVA